MNGADEVKKILRENVEISKESLKILKGVRRANRIAAVLKFFYWLVIIGTALGAYYYLQPYIDQLLNLLKQIQGMEKLLPR